MTRRSCDAASKMTKAASVSDYRALARRRLPHFLFEYLDGGSYDEVTLRRNVEDLQAVALRQRVLRDVSSIDLAVDLFGQRWKTETVHSVIKRKFGGDIRSRLKHRQNREPLIKGVVYNLHC